MPETAQLSDAKRRLLTKYLQGRMEGRPAVQAIPRRAPDEAIPLSYAQEQVWLHAQMAPDIPLYNEPVTIHYTGSLDVAALEQSFNEILRRHEAWRTCFVTIDGAPVQKVEPSVTVPLPVVDLRHLPDEQREAEALRIATEDARKPLDLTQVPLFRVRLIWLRDEEHRLYLNLCHIIFDGVAIYRVFLPELSTLYEAFSTGKPSPLPEPPIQYGDYAAWQRQYMRPEMLSEHVAYWRERLAPEGPVLELPADRPRTPVQSFHGSMYPFKLTSSLTAAIRRLSQSEGTTPFQILLATFAVLLLRYSGEESIAIGSVTAGRDRPGTQDLLGYFLNTVVLQADLTGDPTFRDLIGRMRKLTVEALEHDCVPFGHLIQELKPTRDLSRAPLFQVMFSLEPPMPEVNPAWRLTQMDVDTGATKYDLYLELDERRDEVLARFHYSTDLFDVETIERMAGHWSSLSEAATSNPALRVSDLPLLTDSEQRQLLEWNSTRREYPRDRCIHDLFVTQCEHAPKATAVICGEQYLTYEQLNERSNRVARYLQKLGVGPGDPVGVCLERSLDMVVGLMAILKTGGAYVPMDPSYPSERLTFMLKDSRASIVLTQQTLIRRFPEDGIQQVCLDTDRDKIASERAEIVPAHVRPEDPAYVMYTSGSTGRPKGVVGTHRATVNRLSWMWREYPFQAAEVCCQKTSLSFVDSVWEVFGPLLGGAPSVIIPDEAVKDIGGLVETLAANRVTRIVLVPSLLRAILDHSNDLHRRLPALKLWISSGEALSHDLAQRFFDCMPGHTLLNLYGSTEVAADATYYEVGHKPRLSSVPIGRPISNTQAYVLDHRRQLVPVNVQGEIYIGGDAVARGYLHRPELTTEKFVPDPFSDEPQARLYRTGDLGRYLADGNIEYVGRSDHQVKVRGFRIELGEIESALGRHSGVRQCVVVAREDTSGDKRLVGYYEPTTVQSVTTADLRTSLRTQLPEYMIPGAIVAMEKLPLTPNGKIDRKALPRPGGQGVDIPGELISPRDPLEQILVQTWAKILGVDRVGLDSDFFELGGHSLAAVRMLSEVEKFVGKAIPLATLFQASTVAAFAALLRKDGWAPSWSSLVPIQLGGPRSPLFLVHGAEGNVLLYRDLAQYLGPDQPIYGLQSQGLNGDEHLNTTIQEMAAQYVKDVMTVQPHGPYLLGGYCLGGIIAFEMAQQITALGEKVALVVLLDTYNPSAASHFGLSLKAPLHFLQNLWFHGANLALIQSNDRKKFFVEKVDIELTRLVVRLHAGYQFFQRACGVKTRNNYPHLAIKKNNDRAWLQYVPQPYGGRVVLIRSKGHFAGFANPSFGWNGIVRQGLELHELPLYPKGMLVEPFCRLLADTLKVSLQNV